MLCEGNLCLLTGNTPIPVDGRVPSRFLPHDVMEPLSVIDFKNLIADRDERVRLVSQAKTRILLVTKGDSQKIERLFQVDQDFANLKALQQVSAFRSWPMVELRKLVASAECIKVPAGTLIYS